MSTEYFPEILKQYQSADTCVNEYFQNVYPTEFLNKISDPSLPQHRISVKLNQPIMLLRKKGQAEGLCNGTRMIVKSPHKHFIEAELATGKGKGKRYFLPKMPITPSDADCPIMIKRIQFPIRAAFAMTINKAQGATLNTVGIYLNDPVFSHGQ
jgi:ATP-dependent DNA helicase PIF1